MARISGVEIPNNKRVLIGLTYIYGIGKSSSQKILTKLAIHFDKKVGDLSSEDMAHIIGELELHVIEGDARVEKIKNIRRLMDIGTYRGRRHRSKLPVRGQRTKNNARTLKGKRKTVANKKKAGK